MNRYFILATLIFAALSGCAGHYVEEKTDSLVFFLRLPEATRVQFASSFDNFVLHDADRNSSGSWQAALPVNAEIKYFYVVDGTVYLPECRFRETDDFGSENCLYQP